jgi:hypothetical protein
MQTQAGSGLACVIIAAEKALQGLLFPSTRRSDIYSEQFRKHIHL